MATPQSSQSSFIKSVAVDCSLGSDAFTLRSFHYTESLGQPFKGMLELQSDNADIDFAQLLGKPMTVSVTLPGGGQRDYSGLARCIRQTGDAGNTALYRAEIVPWITCLELGSDCRIFQNKSAIDILHQVFEDLGFSDYDVSGVIGNYSPLEFCAQYNETHSNFVHRLMQRFGIYYFHKHVAGRHTLALCDSHTSHKSFPGYATIPYKCAKGTAYNWEHIFLWSASEQMRSGKFTLKDYAPSSPKADLVASHTSSHSYPHGDLERFEYPGGYAKQDDGDSLAMVRIEQSECREKEFFGEAFCFGLSVGSTFSLEGHPRKDQNASYLTESVDFSIEVSKLEAAPAYSYRSGFKAIPASVQFRPQRSAPTPRIAGVQTAVVVAPVGQDPKVPYTDPCASARVQFHWDRAGSKDEKSSCWLRCSQPSAGSGWGSIFLPLVGNEVIVAFEDGHPDRPIIVGNVYNADNKPPRTLPDDSLKTIVKDVAGNFIALDSKEGAESVTILTAYKTNFWMIGDSREPD